MYKISNISKITDNYIAKKLEIHLLLQNSIALQISSWECKLPNRCIQLHNVAIDPTIVWVEAKYSCVWYYAEIHKKRNALTSIREHLFLLFLT